MSNETSPGEEGFALSSCDLATSFAEIEMAVLDLEPKVRDLNRRLVALFGKCPTSETGNWAYLARNDVGEFIVAFENLQMDKVLQIVTQVDRILDVVEDGGGVASYNHPHAADLGPSVVGDAAGLLFVPTTHVRVVRPS